MKWNKGQDAMYITSDEGYTICICYQHRARDEDEKSEFKYIAWAPHKHNPEYANDPYKAHLNAVKCLAVCGNQNEAKRACEEHFKKMQAEEQAKPSSLAEALSSGVELDYEGEESDEHEENEEYDAAPV